MAMMLTKNVRSIRYVTCQLAVLTTTPQTSEKEGFKWARITFTCYVGKT